MIRNPLAFACSLVCGVCPSHLGVTPRKIPHHGSIVHYDCVTSTTQQTEQAKTGHMRITLQYMM